MSGQQQSRPIDKRQAFGAPSRIEAPDDATRETHGESPSAHGRMPQFGMRGLLIFTTGLCVLFAVLAALRVGYWQMLLGFVATAIVSLIVILLLELYLHYDSDRRGRDGALRRRPPRLGHQAMPRSSRPPIDLAQADPTGIEFVEPAGIAYLEPNAEEDDFDVPIVAEFADEPAQQGSPATPDSKADSPHR